MHFQAIRVPLLAALALLAGPAGAERSVVREENGITVETEGAAERTLPILIGTTTVAAPPERVLAWIEATHTYVDWMHNCEEAKALGEGDGARIVYNRIGSPWPVSDRDVVLRSTRTRRDDGAIRVEFRDTTDPAAPPGQDAVRMARLVGSYELQPRPEGTRVVYTVDSDPGGGLPAWLVRRASLELPYRTLANLRERAEAGPPPPE